MILDKIRHCTPREKWQNIFVFNSRYIFFLYHEQMINKKERQFVHALKRIFVRILRLDEKQISIWWMKNQFKLAR